MSFKERLKTRFNPSRRAAAAMIFAAFAMAGMKEADAFIFTGGTGSGSAPGLNTSVTLFNHDSTNSYATPFVSYGVSVAEGDVPIGGSIVVKDSNNNPVTVQQDQVVTNPNTGYIRYVVLSHPCAETWAASSSKTYTLTSSSSPPNTTPNSAWNASGTPEATLRANTNFILRYSGGDASVNTYSISVNDIILNGNAFPWGTSYPTKGYQRYATGPNCLAWHFWAYIQNDTTTKYQGYVKAHIYLKAWSPTGPFEVHALTEQPNLFNTITQSATTSEMYNQTMTKFMANATLYNGATPVAYFGGPNDYRAGVIPNADFQVSDSSIQMTATSWQRWFAQSMMLSGSGLPTGLNNSTIYTFGGSLQQNFFFLRRDRQGSATGAGSSYDPPWQASHAYNVNDQVYNGPVSYVCVTAGTSASSGGPTGIGTSIADGSVVWMNYSFPFTDQGSGTITAYPINCAYPGCGWVGADQNGDPVWIGSGARPMIRGLQEFVYLTTKTKAVPPYGNVTTYLATSPVQQFNPMMPSFQYFGIQASGDGPGDQRIGWMQEDAVNVLCNGADPYYYNSSLQQGLQWANWPSMFCDERSGYPMTGNNGTDRAGTAYPHMASPQPSWAVSNTGFGVGNMIPTSTAWADLNGQAARNSTAADNVSHMPSPWYGPYLQTGYKVLHDIGVSQANWVLTFFTSPSFTQYVLGGTTYYCVCPTPEITFSQTRSWAWQIRITSQASWICADDCPMQPLLLDMQHDNIYVTNTWYHDPTKAPAAAQVYGQMTNDHHGAYGSAPWTWGYLVHGLAMEAWRNRDSNFYSFLNDWVINRFNLWAGNGIAYVGMYEMVTRTGSDFFGTYDPKILANCLTTQLDVFNSTYGAITQINPTAFGSGYTHATVTISGPTGSGASFKANISSGQITSYSPNVNGTNGDLIGESYTPGSTTVTITGDGTGATATATVGANTDFGNDIQVPYPTQPYMYDYPSRQPNGNLNPSFPANTTSVVPNVRMALALCCTAIPSNSTLRSQLSDWNNLVSTLTSISLAQGGFQWGGPAGTNPASNHKAFCVFNPAN